MTGPPQCAAVTHGYDKTRFDAPKALRAEQAQYGRINWQPTTGTYSCSEYGLEHLIDDRERQNAIEPLNLDIDGTEIVTDMILNDREQRVANLLTTSGNYTHSNTVNLSGLSTAWDQQGTSDPIKDVAITGREAIRSNSGIYPNTLMLGAKVASNLEQHPVIMDRLKYNAQGGVAVSYLEALAKIFKVDRIVIGVALTRTSNEGQADTLADIWGKHAVLAYINPRPAIKQPTLAYMFVSRPRQVEKYRDDHRKSDGGADDFRQLRVLHSELRVVSGARLTRTDMIAGAGQLFQQTTAGLVTFRRVRHRRRKGRRYE